ncbi:MAG: carboxymuconolactone decarboxylase family protein [Kiloniellales bacterium]|nr:carboxymuconolactone decarboxylase family protein [Kiloniellales bacterium]
MTALPPSGAGTFAAEFPDVWKAYEALGAACSAAGPLDDRTRRLIKLALSVGAASEGAVHSHARQGLEAGLSNEEIMQVAALAITTLGFPRAMAAMSWIRDVASESGSS